MRCGGATREFLIVFRVSSNWEGFYFKDEEICRFIENILGKHLELAHDEIQLGYSDVEKQIKKIILKAQFNKVLDLIEDIANEPYERIVTSRNNVISTLLREKFQGSRENLINTYKRQFEKQAAAYWLDTSIRPYKFFPRSSVEQGHAVRQALKTVEESGMTGASVHLRQAVEHINTQQYHDSISDSISAVESVSRQIAPESHTLGQALSVLESKGLFINQELKAGFKQLYNYTNTEEGIRHARLNRDSSGVGLDEAVFMFGACASFAAYLVSKNRQMEQQESK